MQTPIFYFLFFRALKTTYFQENLILLVQWPAPETNPAPQPVRQLTREPSASRGREELAGATGGERVEVYIYKGLAAPKGFQSEMLVSLLLPQTEASGCPTECRCGDSSVKQSSISSIMLPIMRGQHVTSKIWYMKEVVPLPHFLTSNLRGQHFKYC